MVKKDEEIRFKLGSNIRWKQRESPLKRRVRHNQRLGYQSRPAKKPPWGCSPSMRITNQKEDRESFAGRNRVGGAVRPLSTVVALNTYAVHPVSSSEITCLNPTLSSVLSIDKQDVLEETRQLLFFRFWRLLSWPACHNHTPLGTCGSVPLPA